MTIMRLSDLHSNYNENIDDDGNEEDNEEDNDTQDIGAIFDEIIELAESIDTGDPTQDAKHFMELGIKLITMAKSTLGSF